MRTSHAPAAVRSRRRLVAGAAASVLLLTATAPAAACISDCDEDGRVTVNELVTATNLAIGEALPDKCAGADSDGDGTVTPVEMLAALRDALGGCEPAASGCGDGRARGREECDDGNRVDGDGCSADCTLEPNGNPCTGITPRDASHLTTVLVASGLSSPLYVTTPPRDVHRLFIVEQTGRIRIVKDGTLIPDPFLDLSAQVSCCGERGLLSLAFHPSYSTNGIFFVDYTDVSGNTVVSRWHVSADPDRAAPDSEVVVLRQTQPFANHNGGLVAFGPDGYLYIGLGDGGSAGDPRRNGQNPATWLGKLLRIDVDHGEPYAVPADNPFVATAGALPEIWALGLRNPWRFSFDRAGARLVIGDVGQDRYEEIDAQAAGDGGINYGWNVMEGRHCFQPSANCPMQGLTLPVLEYTHDDGCSVTGGYVYRGCALPGLRGTYFYADYCSDFIRSVVLTEAGVSMPRDWTTDLAPRSGRTIEKIASFGEDARGELYLCDLRGAVYRIVGAP